MLLFFGITFLNFSTSLISFEIALSWCFPAVAVGTRPGAQPRLGNSCSTEYPLSLVMFLQKLLYKVLAATQISLCFLQAIPIEIRSIIHKLTVTFLNWTYFEYISWFFKAVWVERRADTTQAFGNYVPCYFDSYLQIRWLFHNCSNDSKALILICDHIAQEAFLSCVEWFSSLLDA